MKDVVRAALVVWIMLHAMGCGKYDVPPVKPSPPAAPQSTGGAAAPMPQPTSNTAANAPAPSPAPQVPAALVQQTSQSPPQPASAPMQSPPAGQAPQPIVRLSAPVALPQTLPDGTAMTFSIDYVVSGTPAGSLSQCAWIVERARGEAGRFPVGLKQQDNMMAIAPGWRPEEGPFQMYIVDQSGQKISNSLSVAATGQ